MDPTSRKPGDSHRLEKTAATLAAAACLVLTLIVWRSISAYQPIWPLPGLYFVELPTVCIAAAFAWYSDFRGAAVLTWAVTGIVVAFSILGAFSVGTLYMPIALLLAIAGASSDIRRARPLTVHLGVCLVAGMAQAALMFSAIRLLYPTAVF